MFHVELKVLTFRLFMEHVLIGCLVERDKVSNESDVFRSLDLLFDNPGNKFIQSEYSNTNKIIMSLTAIISCSMKYMLMIMEK